MKIRFLEPGTIPYKKTFQNYFVYDKYIRTPSHGLMLLATILKQYEEDVLMYSENISYLNWEDILDADVVFIGAFTYQANRAYELANYIKENSKATVVIGGLHPSAMPLEAIKYCDFVIQGEGDESIVDLYQGLKGQKSFDFKGLVYKDQEGAIINTGKREYPENIDVVLDPNILFGYKEATKYNTIWPQVHASRGCPHKCDYCSLINLYGNRVRTRSVDSIIDDIKSQICFFKTHSKKRVVNFIWITDDNFFANREFAVKVLNRIIEEDFDTAFTIQVRYEVGFDDEILDLLKKAKFKEVAMGIEFIEDESFKLQNKKSCRDEIIDSIRNIQRHGLRVRGLFIVGTDAHTKGYGKQLASFVKAYDIKGVLIQGMYFVPGTVAYERTKDLLLHEDWSKYNGNIVHRTKQISPMEMQLEIISASRKIYSKKELTRNFGKFVFRKINLEEFTLFFCEYLWQGNTRKKLKKEKKLIEEKMNSFKKVSSI